MSAETRVRVEPSSRITRSEAIIFSELDDAVVMMDAEAGCYYELDPVGSRIWALAKSRPRVAEVCAALVAEYDVASDRCAGEVRAYLEELRRREVIRVLPQNGANEAGKDVMRDAGTLLNRDRTAATRGPGKLGTRLPWTSPAVRVLSMARTASDTTSSFSGESSPYFEQYQPDS